MSGAVYPLQGNQLPAADPRASVWLSASAGTGKTQVLSARVLRLLLTPGVEPSQILCLTFTKAGAAEMALRINEVLARWVRLGDALLAKDLLSLGADHGPDSCKRARTLFARVLDCPGGGLRIDTIHAFSQWLLAAFPTEAGLAPGARAMEDRDRDMLLREVLSSLLLDAESRGEQHLIDALEVLSVRLGPDKVPAFLLRCAQAREMWEGPGHWQPPLCHRVESLIGLPAGADRAWLAGLCSPENFDEAALRCCLSAYSQWNGKKGQAGRVIIADWLAASTKDRLAALPDLFSVLFSQKDTIKDQESLEKFEIGFGDAASSVLKCAIRIREARILLELAEFLTPAFTLGHAFARAWDDAKAREGLIDFDDQIRLAASLLNRQEQADWIRYKLDRRFDHILVDEAQDTNAAQWDIVFALTGDFFSGLGARAEKLRTIFVVGDYKQAIFRFQGTSPENFEAARRRFKAMIGDAARNAEALRANLPVPRFEELGLGRSYRSASEVLEFVDKAIGHLGHEALGLANPAESHAGDDGRPGFVGFWRPVGYSQDEEALEEDGDEGSEGWLSKPDRLLANRIAQQVREWMETGFPLYKDGARRAGPGDVMVLVRKRKELAGLIVARLHAAGVPVAGVDRLRLGAPLAVRDLLAAVRFAVQPLDDLNLASLLVSPLLGWAQEDLLEHGWRPRGERLWTALRRSRAPMVERTADMLVQLLNRADNEPPQPLLHWLLTGPWQGRRRLVARLGHEANDPINELLNAAASYASVHTPSLLGFLHWFDTGEGELKREAAREGGMVRVMTAHGAKGLQAPIVILADAAGNPKASRSSGIDLPDVHDPGRKVPLPPLPKEDIVGRIRTEADRVALAEMQEHWRLLYVAMTRAEEALFVTGSLGSREKAPAPESWYARLEAIFSPDNRVEDARWGYRLEWGTPPQGVIVDTPARRSAAEAAKPAPSWLNLPVVAEPRPPRPLAPSSLGEDVESAPPFPPGVGREAARRGTLIHKLLERLPEVARDERADAALRWLARNAADLDGQAHRELVASAMDVLDDPAWADLFGPESLAEVPFAAVVGANVVAGTIDRLLIGQEVIRIVDFKTARRPPEGIGQVPVAILRQMGAYAAALEQVYPGRRIEVALLYTQSPRLIAIPPDLLASHKPGLSLDQ